jgi:hypothetical protein
MSGNVGNVISNLDMIKNVSLAAGMPLITAGFPRSELFHDSATMLAANLNFGSTM